MKERQDSIHKAVKIKLFSEASSKRVFHSISSQTNPFRLEKLIKFNTNLRLNKREKDSKNSYKKSKIKIKKIKISMCNIWMKQINTMSWKTWGTHNWNCLTTQCWGNKLKKIELKSYTANKIEGRQWVEK